jgi:CheY-like chemotaxis protein
MSRPCILVVDDLPTNRFLLEETLAELDAEIVSADSGRAALDVASEKSPHVALVDFQMPDLDGGQTAIALKGREGAPFVYVVLVSGYRDVKDEVPAAVREAVDRFISKPYTLANVRDAVLEGLRIAAERRQRAS